MKFLSFSCMVLLLLFSSCYDTAYNPDYIISDSAQELPDEADEDN